MKAFRGVGVFLPQLLILLIIGARFDLLLGFNLTDTGYTTLLFLLVLVPLINLIWPIVEIIISITVGRRRNRTISLFLPGLALFFFLESIFIDIFMLLGMKM